MNCRVSQPATFDSLRIAGHLPSTFVPTARHLTAFKSALKSAPAPGNFPSIRKKRQIPEGQPGGGGGRAQLELTDA